MGRDRYGHAFEVSLTRSPRSLFRAVVVSTARINVSSSVVFGTAGVLAGSGIYRISLPATAHSAVTVAGNGMIFDSSTSTMKHVTPVIASSTTVDLYLGDASAGLFQVTDSTPWTWAANDQIWINLSYEAA